MRITRTSILSGKTSTRDVNATMKELQLYYKGNTLLQNAFPNTSPDDREFIKTGITPEEWDETFLGIDSNATGKDIDPIRDPERDPDLPKGTLDELITDGE